MEHFTDFAVIAGGATAALIGLLFVAVSIRADWIGRSVELRSRVAGILTIFLSVLAGWLCVALPNPAPWVLGLELVVMAALARVLDRLNPNVITAVLVGLAGILLLLDQVVGLFLLALATLVAFVGGVIGAWLVLVRGVD